MADKKDGYDARLGGERKAGKLPPVDESKRSNIAGIVFNLFIIIFIGYAFYIYVQDGGEAGMLEELGERFEVIDAPRDGDPRIDRLQHNQRLNTLSRVFPVKRPTIAKRILQEGSGAPAACGQVASYRLVSGFGSNQEVSETRQVRLGSVDVPQGLTFGIEGMRVGEVRQVSIPQELWTGSYPANGKPSISTDITIELQQIAPDLPNADMPLRRFIVRGGGGLSLRCGDLAMLHLTVWSANGKKIFSSKDDGKQVYLYLGEGKTPYGIERGLLGMERGGAYSILMASDLWNSLADNNSASSSPPPYDVQQLPSDLELPEGQIVLVDIDYPKDLPDRRLPAPATGASDVGDTNNIKSVE